MKKFLYSLIIIFITQSISFANYNDIYIADIQYDWIKKSDVEKEALIDEVHDILFENSKLPKKDIRADIKGKHKDKERLQHYMAAAAGHKEYGDEILSAFYYKKQKYIYMYAVQNKKDVSKSYYYDALGNLRYIDYIYGEYPDYPYHAIQYRTSGKPVSAIYYASKDNQYIFDPDGTFKGVWYKHNLYDKHSKVILKRTAY